MLLQVHRRFTVGNFTKMHKQLPKEPTRDRIARDPAVLKYSWTPVDRLPEGAIYKVLELHKISCLPKIYSSGILVKDFLGYRLEYLLMEDCGESVECRFLKIQELCRGRIFALQNYASSAYADITNVVNQTVTCLVEADKAGVLHRDISAGNITICNGQVRVIDWGYAKLTQPDTPEIKAIADEWGFDLGNVTKNENNHDGMTGTPLFMSIRVLLERPTRSLIDDIESLFYVAMYALSCLLLGPSASPAFNAPDYKAAAFIKLGMVISRKSYLKFFGVECSDDVRAQLDLLRQLLFCRNGQFIGEKLVEDEADVRSIDASIMRKIIGSDLADRIYGSPIDNDTPVVKAPAKRKIRAAKTRKPAPKKQKPANNSNIQDSIRHRLRPRPGRSTK
ncbi:hypothetical protein GGF49_001438 [Coemansia sp. RSA 1853]|nr:hypothetical protein GGF49_001438 [Coemansia sp. RSA 1853]